jgi:hypothetical protein
MSVQLTVLKGGKDFEDVEIMANDYGAEHVWLWLEENGDNRLDLSRDQLRALRVFINDFLER